MHAGFSVHEYSRKRKAVDTSSITTLSLIFIILFTLSGCRGRANPQKDVPPFIFSSDINGNSDIFLFDPKDPYIKNLTDNSYQDLSPAWSPDNTEIAFVSDRSDTFEIYTMRPDGSNVKRITNNNSENLPFLVTG